jgi:large subunit ribosomal protein L21
MYAVIEQGSKQYKVQQGDVIEVELADVAPEAEKIELDKVLFIGGDKQSKVGTPYIEGAKVIGSFDTNAENAVVKGVKVYPTKLRRRKASMTRTGHRQKYLKINIEKIEA